jgi:hypothetical protein
MAKFRRLLVVVPTRNRAELTGAAVDSLLALGRSDVSILVSDNSTDEAESERLERHCLERNVERLRPPKPLAMSDHWEWAMQRALERRQMSHISFQTDRHVVFRAQFAGVLRVLDKFPSDVVTYPIDLLNELEHPYRLTQRRWTGRVLRIPSHVLVEFSANSNQWLMSPILPRLLNCVVPREIVLRVRKRFGVTCGSSIAPDYAFAFRCLAVVRAILHYDRPPMVSYALHRSNGASAVFGRVNSDHADFIANFDDRGANFAAPIPGLVTSLNAIAHEYNVVLSAGQRWPAVDWGLYLSGLRQEAEHMDDGPTRTAVERAIASHAAGSVAIVSGNRAGGSGAPSRDRRARARLADMNGRLQTARRFFPLRSRGKADGELDVGDLTPVVTTWQTTEEALEHARERPLDARSGMSRFEVEVLRSKPDANVRKLATVTDGA